MKELEKVFIGRGEVKGFYFEQVAKSDKAYLYKVTCAEGTRPYYEIFERRINTQFNKYPTLKVRLLVVGRGLPTMRIRRGAYSRA